MLVFYFGILICSLMMLLGGVLFNIINTRHPKNLDLLQGLSAGMLLAIIFIGILPESIEFLENAFDKNYLLVFLLSIGIGALVLPGFEKILPVQHHHEFDGHSQGHNDHRTALILLTAFGIHSTFELLAVLVSGATNPVFGWSLALVIGLHNIPIGFIIYSQLNNFGYPRKKNFILITFLGILQCIIAMVLYFLLLPFMGESLSGILLAMTSGTLLYLTFDELLPEIYKKESQHCVNAYIILGILVMTGITLLGGH